MRGYVTSSAAHENAARTRRLLDRIVVDADLHARFVNTLSRLEYVGVRKILKSRRSERIGLDGLQHILDEAVHALRLKKAAVALASGALKNAPRFSADPAVGLESAAGKAEKLAEARVFQQPAGRRAAVVTFADAETLAGDAGEDYLQALDRRAEEGLLDLPPAERGEANYRLTSAAVEVRAQVFYPIYDLCLQAHQVGFSVAAISKDEDRHLEEMAAGLERTLSDWRRRLEAVLAAEEALYGRFLSAVEAALPAVGFNGAVSNA
jgi:hypothetical protein